MRAAALIIVAGILLGAMGPGAQAQNRIVGPSDLVRVTISDWDLNANPRGVDRYEDPEFVVFRTSRDDVGEAHPEIVETGPSTGLFEFEVQLETDELACRLDRLDDPRFAAQGGSDPSVGVCPGDVLLVQYEDNRGTDGRSTLVDYVFEVKSWNPEFTTDKSSYSAGEMVTVNIYDPDADRDPDVPDTLREIRIFSESDPAGEQFSAIETGRHTGTFKVSFITSLESQGNAILVRDSDEVTVQYTDDFPEDFSALEEEKIFSFVMVIDEFHDGGTLALSRPSIGVGESRNQTELAVGQQATVSTTVTSPAAGNELPFVAIVDIRNSDGVTVSVGWQSGVIRPQESAELGMSWIPQDPGRFEIRIFLISNLQNPQVLSTVVQSEVTVTADGD